MNLRSAHARGDEPGTCGSDSLSRVHAGCKENVLLKGKICFFSMFHEYQMVFLFGASRSRNKMTSIFNVAWCALLLQTFPAATHFYASYSFVCTSLGNFEHVSYAYTRLGVSPRYVPAACFLVCGTDLLLLLSNVLCCATRPII